MSDMSEDTERILRRVLVAALILAGLIFWGIGSRETWRLPNWLNLMAFGFFFLLILLAFSISVVLSMRQVFKVGKSLSAEPRESALDILRKRYARGEIDKAEFEAKKKGLG